MTPTDDTRAGHPDRNAVVLEFQQRLNGMTWSSLRVHTRILQPYGLTVFQALALKAIGDAAKPLDMAHLAERTEIPPSTLTTVIDRLERGAFAERQRHPTDRRKVLVSLTDSGYDLLRSIERADLRLTTAMLENVSDQELQVVLDVVQHMARSIEAIDADPILLDRLILEAS